MNSSNVSANEAKFVPSEMRILFHKGKNVISVAVSVNRYHYMFYCTVGQGNIVS